MTVLLAWTAGVVLTIPVFVASRDVLITTGWMGIAGGFVAAAWMAVDVIRCTGKGAIARRSSDSQGDLGSTLDSSHVL